MILEIALLAAQALQTKNVNLSWIDSDPVTFNVYRANGTCASSPSFALIGSSSVMNFVDKESTGRYCYQVTAFNANGESGPSNQVDVFIPAPPTNVQGVAQ